MFYSRPCTNAILELIDEGLLDIDTVLSACLSAMTEREVQQMAESNEFCERCDVCGDYGLKDWITGVVQPCGHGGEEEEEDSE